MCLNPGVNFRGWFSGGDFSGVIFEQKSPLKFHPRQHWTMLVSTLTNVGGGDFSGVIFEKKLPPKNHPQQHWAKLKPTLLNVAGGDFSGVNFGNLNFDKTKFKISCIFVGQRINFYCTIVANNFKVEKITPGNSPPATFFQSWRGWIFGGDFFNIGILKV